MRATHVRIGIAPDSKKNRARILRNAIIRICDTGFRANHESPYVPPTNECLEGPPMKIPFSDPAPPTELAVVGENKDDPSQLLVMGTDGSYYAYSLSDGGARVVEPDDHWVVEPVPSQDLFT